MQQKSPPPPLLADDQYQTWVFDLDNTLYPSTCNLFAQIDEHMGSFISDLLGVDRIEARRIQKGYLHGHGTTLSGLMHEHNIDPQDFLAHVHNLDLSAVPENPELAVLLHALPGRKIIFTNASIDHADRVMAKLGLTECFDDVFGIEEADFTPKPHHETYEKFVTHFAIDAPRAVMFEDMASNLVAAERLGMATVLVHSHGDWMGDPGAKDSVFKTTDHSHVHYFADDLTDFLQAQVDLAGIELKS